MSSYKRKVRTLSKLKARELGLNERLQLKDGSSELPSSKEKEIADLGLKRLYHPANHMLANGSQLSQQHLKSDAPVDHVEVQQYWDCVR